MRVELVYTVLPSGRVDLKVSGEPYGDYSDIIPRIGISFEVPGCDRAVEWYGHGPGENYPDSLRANPVGHYRTTVDDMFTPYVILRTVPTARVPAGLPCALATATVWS